MYKYLKISILLFDLAFMLSCASIGESLKKNDLSKYNNIIGSWYILSPENPGDIIAVVTFNDNGSISGDIEKVFGFKKAKWTDKIYTYDGWTTNSQCIGIYNLDIRDHYPAKLYFYKTDLSNWKYFRDDSNEGKYNNFYEGYLQTLNIIQYEYDYSNIMTEKYIRKRLQAVYTKDINISKNIQEEYLVKNNNDSNNWVLVNKNSISEHINFLKSVKEPKLKSTAETSLHELLDKKVIKYIQNKYKPYTKYTDNMIIYENGTEMCKFYEFLKMPIIFKNNVSGEKYDISIEKNDSITNGFDIICKVNGKELNISFKPYKSKLVLVGLSSGFQVNPKSWEFAVSTIATSWNKYPEDLDAIDVELLEKL